MTGRAGVLYLEKGLKVTIGSEMLFGEKYDLVIYLNDPRSWRIEGEVDEDKKREIVERVKLEFKRIKVDWQ